MRRTIIRSCWIGLLAAACGAPSSSPDSQLALRFARQAVDGPCPEAPISNPQPPALDALEVVLTTATGERHARKTISLAGDRPARVGGLKPGSGLRLTVIGLVGDEPRWLGSATDLTVHKARTTYADVFMTRLAGVSCTPRPLHEARIWPAAAATGSGRTIIAGGANQGTDCGAGCTLYQASAAADLFDTGTGVIFPAPRLNSARLLASATVLPDGRVLVVGGARRLRVMAGEPFPLLVDEADLVPTYEVYQPELERWVEKPLPERQGRIFHSATALPDGRVLVIGGGVDFESARDDALLFDPAGESVGDFEPIADPMATPRLGHSAVWVEDRLLVLGGAVVINKSAVEEFVPAEQGGNFSELPDGDAPINLFFAAARVNPLWADEIVLAGGSIGDGEGGLLVPSIDNAWIYSVSAGTAEALDALQAPRLMPAAAVLGDGSILFAGGYTDLELSPGGSLEIYDPATGGLRVPAGADGEAALSVARGGCAAAAVGDGRALLAGGAGPSGPLASGELFTAAAAPAD